MTEILLDNMHRDLEAESNGKAGGPSISATFQTVLTLCLSFLVIAAIRTPSLTEDALDRARLVERVQQLTERLHQRHGELAAMRRTLETEGLSPIAMLEWLQVVVGRIRKAEADAVVEICYANAAQTWFPPREEIRKLAGKVPAASLLGKDGELSLSDGDTQPKAIDTWHAVNRDQLVRAITDRVSRKVLAPHEHLFNSTRNAIRRKADELLAQYLACQFLACARDAVQAVPLDWSDFRQEELKLTGPVSLDACPETFKVFRERVCRRVPSPSIVPDRSQFASAGENPEVPRNARDALAKLAELIESEFQRRCEGLNDRDGRLAERIAELAESAHPLRIEHLSSGDGGRAIVAAFLRREAGLAEGQPVGPQVQKALEQATENLFAREARRVQWLALNRLAKVGMDAIERSGVHVAYQDFGKRTERIRQIEAALLACVGLPGGQAADPRFRDQLKRSARQRAQELFDSRLRDIQTEAARTAKQYFEAKREEIAAGKTALAKVAARSPDEARGMMLETFYREKLGITNPTTEHRLLWETLARRAIAEGVGRRIAGVIPRISGPPVLAEMTVFDWQRQDYWVRRIADSLLARSPEELRPNDQYRQRIKRKAQEYFKHRMQELQEDFLAKARRRIERLADRMPPEAWKQHASAELDEELYRKLMQEMTGKTVPPMSKAGMRDQAVRVLNTGGERDDQ